MLGLKHGSGQSADAFLHPKFGHDLEGHAASLSTSWQVVPPAEAPQAAAARRSRAMFYSLRLLPNKVSKLSISVKQLLNSSIS